MTRKSIQICVTGTNKTQQTQGDFVLTDLANDGTIWNKFGHHSNWMRVEDVPQDVREKVYSEAQKTTEIRGNAK